MTKEQLQQAISKSEYIKGLSFFKEYQDAANKEKFIQSVKANGTALTKDENGAVDLAITVAKKTTANTGYAASYQVKVNNVAVGDDINVAKDWLLTGVTKGTVAAADKEAGGKFEDDNDFAVGNRYVDMAFNVKANGDDGTETTTHIYLNVQEFIDIYTNGNGLNLSNGEFSVKIDSSNANGLAVDANGLKMNTATADTVSYVAATGTYVSGTTYYTTNTGATTVDTSDFMEGTTDVSSYFVQQTTAGTAGAMSAADKSYIEGLKATTFTEITRSDIQALFTA